MQTQVQGGIRKYFDNEAYLQYQHQCEAWYVCYPDALHRLLVHPASATVAGLHVVPAPGLHNKSLSVLRDLIAGMEYSEDEFTRVHAVIVDPHYTFVPEALFDPAAAAVYLQPIHPLRKLHSAYYDKVQDRITVWSAPDLFYNAVRLALPGVHFHHYATLLAEAFAGMNVRRMDARLDVHLEGNGMDVFHYVNGKLQFHNHFPYEADTDVVYFLLSVAEQLNLAPEQRQVVLSGNISPDNSLIGLMKKYIPRVQFMKRPEGMQYPAAFREFHEHWHYIELSSLLCAL